MPTARGWIFAALSLLVLAVGVLRDELGAVIWGGSVLLLETVIVSAALVGRSRMRSKAGSFAAGIECDIVEAGMVAPVAIAVPRMRLLPGFFLTHHMRLAWSTRVCARSVPVQPGSTSRWMLPTEARGDFRCDGSELTLRDAFGFTVSRIVDSHPARLIVVPADPGDHIVLPADRGGETTSERSDTRVRSEDLHDVRPYTPGDDMRLVSWKHLATYQELLVRIGELIPPARGRVEITVDGFLPSGASAPEAGDALMRTLRAIVRQTSHAGVELLCRFPALREPVRLNEEALLGTVHDPKRLEAAAAMAGFLPCAVGKVGGTAPSQPPVEPEGLLLTARSQTEARIRPARVLSVRPPFEDGQDARRAVFLRKSG